MQFLTVVTTVFMPLTLITGWYGMNFHSMPELDAPWAYPAVILVSLAILLAEVLFFSKEEVVVDTQSFSKKSSQHQTSTGLLGLAAGTG